jgi:polysaccharide deacetylase 2 family uncharacterized protein YibQ
MTNPLVEHLREGADATGGGMSARIRRLLSSAYWKRLRLHMRQRPVIRVCLGLVAAFFCGIVLGVGVAAMIAPGPAAYSVADGAGTADGTEKRGEPVVAVSVREEAAASSRRRRLSLLDIDPISNAEAAPRMPPMPTHVTRPAAPDAAPDKASLPSAPAASADAAAVPPPNESAASGAVADIVASEHTPARLTPDAESKPDGSTAAPPPGDQNRARKKDGRSAPARAAGSEVSFEGARSVAEAARGGGVPHAQVALGPLLLKAEPVLPAPTDGDVAPKTDGRATEPTADAPESVPDADDVSLPPHPSTKNLQLAALPMMRPAAWIRNAVAVPDKPRDAMIAMLIDDMGIDQKRTKAIIRLPGPLTLSFIPYGYHLEKLVASARANGHEIMLHQPMEPIDPEADPGPNALRTTVSIEENRRRLLWLFTRLNGIVGLNNHMGSRFTAWREGMEMVMEEVSERGLLFIDSVTNNESMGFKLAHDRNLPSAYRDVFIDHDMSAEAIEHSLKDLERVAQRRGYAVGIAHPHDRTREALETWIIDARSRGFDFVPISHIVRQRMKSG